MVTLDRTDRLVMICGREFLFNMFIKEHSSDNIWFSYSVPLSDLYLSDFMGPCINIKFSNIAFATDFADLSGIGAVTRYFVRSQIIVTAY